MDMSTGELAIYIGIGALLFISAVILLVMYLYYIKRIKPQQPSKPVLRGKTVMTEKADRVLNGESQKDRLTRLKRDKEKKSLENALASVVVQDTSYKDVEIVVDQQENDLDKDSPANVRRELTPSAFYEEVTLDDVRSSSSNVGTAVERETVALASTNNNEVERDGMETDGIEKDHMFSSDLDTSINDQDTIRDDDSYEMEENEMYVTAGDLKTSMEKTTMHYEAESGDIYAGVMKT